MSSVKKAKTSPRNSKTVSAANSDVDMPDVDSEPQHIEEDKPNNTVSEQNAGGNIIASESQIIIGVERSQDTGWDSLHLLNSLYAVSVRPDQNIVVLAEGPGKGRLRNIRIPFKNIFRFKALDVPIGCIWDTPPINDAQLDNQQAVFKGELFFPVMVQLIIKHSSKSDFVSIRDIGMTPPPAYIPLLSKRLEERRVTSNIRLKTVDDCFALAKAVKDWVRNANSILTGETQIQVLSNVDHESEESLIYRQLRKVWAELNPDEPDVRQILVTAMAAVGVSIFLYRVISQSVRKVKMVRAARVRSSFPLDLAINDSPYEHYPLTVDDLCKSIRTYHEETNRPSREAFDAISEHINDWKERRVTIDSSKDLSFLEDNAPRPINIIDPTRKINEKGRILSGQELRHEDKLRKVFENEGIDVYYYKDLPFLSLLVEYKTEDSQNNYAVIIKEGLHQALKEFLLAHEMGHWFLHVNSGVAARSEQVDRFLRSSARRTFLENEADDFAMAVLFPPAFLADREILKDKLSTEELLEEFLGGMALEATPRLREEMRHYISEHLNKYKAFKENKAPKFLTIEVKSINEKDLKGLLTLIQESNETFYWVRLNRKSMIIDASENSVELFGRTKTDIINAHPLDLVVPEEKQRMELRGRYRMKHKKAIYYFTEVLNKAKNSSCPVMVYSFPILDSAGEYAGAMAALRHLDERDVETVS